MDWILENKDWIFGGIGVSVISVIIAVILHLRRKPPQPAVSQSAGGDATYFSAGRDVKVQVVNKTSGSQPRKANLALVDMQIKNEGQLPIVEFLLRNNSDEVVVLKRLEVTTLNYWEIKSSINPSAMPISAKYDINISPQKSSIATYNIAQEIRPQEGERFSVALHSDHAPYPFVGLFLYMLAFRMIYNEDNRILECSNVLVHIQSKMEIIACCDPGPSKYLIKMNKNIAKSLLKTIDKNTITLDGMIDAIKSWADAPL